MKSDSQRQRDVLKELEQKPRVDRAQIGVIAHHALTTLSGQALSFGAKYEAVKAARRARGGTVVADDLEVRLLGFSERTDTEIAEAAVRALKENCLVPDDRIRVTVRDGWIVLDGMVEWQYQRAAAESCVRYLTGVHGVRDQITIERRPTSNDIKLETRGSNEASCVVRCASGDDRPRQFATRSAKANRCST
jgi:osmotically-inducible protein OsmY